MIQRYSRAEMREVWTEQRKLEIWLQIELLASEALAAEGCVARRILAVGGGTQNQAWMQIVSDIAGITQEIPVRQAGVAEGGAAYGDAFLAGIGAGIFSGTKDISRWARDTRLIQPRLDARAVHDGHYRIYRELYERNSGLMHNLARLGG